MADLIRWPFPLPAHFLDQLGYPRVVEAFDSPAMRARLAELLRRQGIDVPLEPPTGPRRYVLLHWEPAGDELAFTDGVHSGAPPGCRRRCSVPSAPGCSSTRSTWAAPTPRPPTR